MSKYYDVKEIRKKMMEELSEIDIDDRLYYFFKKYEFCFSVYDYGIYPSDIDRIQWIFHYQEYDEIEKTDFEIMKNLGKYIKENNIFRDMIEARCALNDYLFKNNDPNDEEITKLTSKFEITAEFYLWTKYIFSAVVKIVRRIYYERLSLLNDINANL